MQRCIEKSAILGGTFLFYISTCSVSAGTLPKSTTNTNQIYTNLMWKARAALDTENYDQAIAVYRDAVKADPTAPAPHAFIAVAYSAKDECFRALPELHAVTKLPIKTALDEDACSYASAHSTLKLDGQALINRAIEHDPNQAEYYVDRAEWSLSKSRLEPAFADVDQAIKLNPKLGRAYFQRARLNAAKHTWDLAKSEIDKAIALSPNVSEYEYGAAIAMARKNLPGALAANDAALRICPNYRKWMEYGFRARIYGRFEQLSKSLQAYDSAARSAKEMKCRFNAAQIEDKKLEALYEANHWDEALAQADVVWRAHNQLGEEKWAELSLQSFWQQRQRILSELNETRLSSAIGQYQSRHLIGNGEIDPAALKGKRASQLRSCAEQLLVDEVKYFDSIDDAENALRVANSAVAMDAKYATALAWRGKTYTHLNQWKPAIADLTEAAKLDPDRPITWDVLAKVQAALKQNKPAYDSITHVINACGDDEFYTLSAAYALRSKVAGAIGNKDQAWNDAEKAVEYYCENDGALIARAKAAYNAGRYQIALAYVNERVGNKSDSQLEKGTWSHMADLVALRAKIYDKLGKPDLAAKDRKEIEFHANEFFGNMPFRASSKTP